MAVSELVRAPPVHPPVFPFAVIRVKKVVVFAAMRGRIRRYLGQHRGGSQGEHSSAPQAGECIAHLFRIRFGGAAVPTGPRTQSFSPTELGYDFIAARNGGWPRPVSSVTSWYPTYSLLPRLQHFVNLSILVATVRRVPGTLVSLLCEGSLHVGQHLLLFVHPVPRCTRGGQHPGEGPLRWAVRTTAAPESTLTFAGLI